MQKLEDMNLIDNFLFQEVARNKEYGGEFCRIILETILGREIKEVEIDVEVEKSIPGATLESHGIRLDALVKERDPRRMESVSVPALPLTLTWSRITIRSAIQPPRAILSGCRHVRTFREGIGL